MISTDAPDVVGYYDYRLVVLSVLLAMLGSYCTIELAGRVTKSREWIRMAWLVGGAIAMGIATWSMHYAGMLAFRLPIPVQYDWPTSLLAYVASLLASALGLFVASRREMGFGRAFVSSIFIGGGIAALHYLAMESMRLQGMCHYSPGLVALSVILAVAVSLLSLWLMFHFREEPIGKDWRKIPSALLLGAAILTMHYTGMASVSFRPSAALPDLSHAVPVSDLGILGVALLNVLVVGVVVVTSVADRFQKQKTLLDELYEQAPQAVTLMNVDHRIVRVNKEFTRIFGYSSEEAVGRNIDELIVPAESRDDTREYTDLVAQGQRVDAESVLQRKDGSRLDVSVVCVPVSLPRGEVAIYAIHRDITRSKQAGEALRQANERLQWLSRRLFEVQEEERRHLARELHDEIGQALTAAKLNLKIIAPEVPPAAADRLEDSIQILDRLLQQVRQLSLDLRPPLLDELGLVPALRWLADQQAKRARLRLPFTANVEGLEIGPSVRTACFRIAQEAITNAIRYASAKSVAVELRQEAEGLWLSVRDDGVGFDPSAVQEPAGKGASVGLLSMKERASLLGGKLEVISAPGRGVEIRAWFPFAPPSPIFAAEPL